MKAYQDLLRHVLENGVDGPDRTGTGTRSVFGGELRLDLRDGFPLLTTKRVHWKGIVGELLWFLSGSTSAKELRERWGVTIWDEWQDARGELGPVYGKQWRAWNGSLKTAFWLSEDSNPDDLLENPIDQIERLIDEIRRNPYSRRLLVSAWNVAEIEDMALQPCHYAFQCYVRRGRLSLKFNMRSTDIFLGLPFNLASYALLTHMIAQVCRLDVGELLVSFGDLHLYRDHVDQAREQLSRKPKTLPRLWIDGGVKKIDDFEPCHFSLLGYQPDPAIPAPVAV